MPTSLNDTQQARIYNSFESFLYGLAQAPLDDQRRLEQIEVARTILQQHVLAGVSQGLPLQEAMLEYLVIREHEEALHLPKTPVPAVLVPHFLSLSHGELQAVVKRLCFFSPPSASPPTSQGSDIFSAEDTKKHFQALLRTSHLRLLMKQLAAATGEKFDPRYLETERSFTVYILWERSHQMYNYIEVRFDLDGTITIQGVSIPMHEWQSNRSALEKALEQAYRHPKLYDAGQSRQ